MNKKEPLPMGFRHVWEGKSRQIGFEIQIQIQIEGIGRVCGLTDVGVEVGAVECGRVDEAGQRSRRSEVRGQARGADGAGWHR